MILLLNFPALGPEWLDALDGPDELDGSEGLES